MGVDWVRLVQDRDQWQAVANTEMSGFYKRCDKPSIYCDRFYRAAEYDIFIAQRANITQGHSMTAALHGDTVSACREKPSSKDHRTTRY